MPPNRRVTASYIDAEKFLATLGGAAVAWPLRGARAVGRDAGDWIHEWLSRPASYCAVVKSAFL